jgi:hypothetical protein
MRARRRSPVDAEHAVAEIHRVADLGYKAAYFSVTPGSEHATGTTRRLGTGVGAIEETGS